MLKKTIALCIVILCSFFLFAEDGADRLSPEQLLSSLLDDEGKSDEQRRLDYIEAAEISQVIGELKSAADLFKKASFAVKGKKDFESLYSAAVLNVEMAFYKEAEADIRAILTFSNDSLLRIKATVLSARVKKLSEGESEAKDIIRNIFESSSIIPNEAYRFALEIFRPEEIKIMNKANIEYTMSKDVLSLQQLTTPENVFGNFEPVLEQEQQVLQESTDIDEQVVSIQLGSFSVRENAEELKKSVDKTGLNSIVKLKTVNGKEYFSLIVPVEDGISVQQTIIELKEKGYEGYPVY